MNRSPLVVYTEKGLYCPAGDFYIDPVQGVEHAVITHAHSDHLYRGSQRYYCTDRSLSLVKCRLSKRSIVQSYPYGRIFTMNGVRVSFHPAGHMLGSAQVRLEANDEVWVVSGDYKRAADPSCDPFEVVPCDVFITETTFARPVYRWGKNPSLAREILEWWTGNEADGKTSVLFCYAMGKAQRILAELATVTDKPVMVYPSMEPMIACYREQGIRMLPTRSLEHCPEPETPGGLLFAPPRLKNKDWLRRFQPIETAFASGWMQDSYRAAYWGSAYDKGFVVSDHADWDDLVETIRETGAQQVYTMPGSGRLLAQHLKQNFGLSVNPVKQLKPVDRLK